MIEQLMQLAAAQADSVEVLAVEQHNSPLNFYNGRGIDIIHRDLHEVSLRVIRDGRLGVVVGSMPLEPEQMVASAVQAAMVGPQVSFEFPRQSSKGGGGVIFDQTLESISSEVMVDDGVKIYDYMRRYAPEINLNLYLDNERKTVTVLNSSGKFESYTMTTYTVALLSMYDHSKEGINKEITSCRYFSFPQEKIDELIAENEYSQHILRLPTGALPVIFRASSTWSLLYRILEGANGINYVRGITPLKEKLGQQIFGPQLTMIDDPTMDFAPGATPFDDEGVPTAKKAIVEKGIFKNFIFDLDSGARSGLGSTGNGIKRTVWGANIELPPGPRFNNLVVQPGRWSLEEMIADMGEGLLVNDVIGFHAGNMLQGHYSMNVGFGFYVKDGKIQGRVMDTMIAGNIYEDFHRVKGLGNKLEKNNLAYSPDIYLSSISVSGAA